MLIFPGALPVAPSPEQAFAVQPAPSVVKTVSPVASLSKTRNETGYQTGSQAGDQSGNHSSAILAPIPNPDEPSGPTPAFKANLLEAERERFRAGPSLPDQDETQAETEKAPLQYAKTPIPEAYKVDIAL